MTYNVLFGIAGDRVFKRKIYANLYDDIIVTCLCGSQLISLSVRLVCESNLEV